MTDPTTGRLTDTGLDEIAARAAALYEYGAEACGPDVDQLADTDVPKLLAEVRRLRAVPAALPSIHANDVEGFCPACGHGVLMLGDGGHVVCTLMDCPRPEAADELLRNAAVPSAPAGRADDDPRSIPVYTPGMAPGEEIAMLRRTLIAAEDSRVELRAENARLRDRLWKRDSDRAPLRDLIAEAMREHGMVHLGDQVPADEYDCCADAVLAKLPPLADRAAVLREAIKVAEDEARHLHNDMGQKAAKGARLVADRLHRLVDEAEHEEPVRCPLCADARALDTPAEAREHFTTVHPEERLVGSGPWPLLANRADEAQPFTVQVWPLARVLAEVRCGSQDWTWDEEWADLDHRHAATGYLNKLEQQIQANGITMPVLIGTDGRLWDGHHRLRIAVRLGIDYVPVEVPAVVESGKEA